MGRKLFLVAAAVILFWGHPPSAQAGYIVNVTESFGDVVAVGSGTINTAALLSGGAGPLFGGDGVIDASTASIAFGDSGPSELWALIAGPGNFGIGGSTLTFSAFGSAVGISGGGILVLPLGYVSGTALGISSATWGGETIGSLGLTPGTYVWTWGAGATADSFTLDIAAGGGPAVPEPSVAETVTLGLGGIITGLLLKRRRAAARQPPAN